MRVGGGDGEVPGTFGPGPAVRHLREVPGTFCRRGEKVPGTFGTMPGLEVPGTFDQVPGTFGVGKVPGTFGLGSGARYLWVGARHFLVSFLVSGRPRVLWGLWMAAFLSAWPVGADSLGELRTVPVPSLESFEPAVREQLEEAQAAVDEGLGSVGDGLLRPGSAPALELADAFGRAGRLYLFYDRSDAAEACLANAATLEPTEFAWHYYLGSLYQDDGRLGPAADSLNRALELEPEDLPALLRLAEVRYRAI